MKKIMNWNKKYIFSLLLCAPVIFAGCGSDDGDSDGTPAANNFVGLTAEAEELAKRITGDDGSGQEWAYSSVTQSGQGATTGELSGWADFELELSIDNPDGAEQSVIEFSADRPAGVDDAVWPARGSFSIDGTSGDEITITRIEENSRFTDGTITTNTAGNEITIQFEVEEEETASSARQGSSSNERVGGVPVAVWVFVLVLVE